MIGKKKKIVFQSDFIVKTGFGRVTKALLSYLYKTGKYDIVNYCCGIVDGQPDLQRTPWKSRGCLPNDQNIINELNRDPGRAQDASYGGYLIDQVIKEEKPDVWIGAQDPWGFVSYYKRPWYNKINSLIWTTLDSLPILPEALEQAKNSKHYWIWSSFATKALHKLGQTHVKTVHGPIEDSCFYRLEGFERKELRKKHNISEDAFIIGFVFRNQLRKSVPNLLQGYAQFKKENPEIKNTYLLFHTNFSETWNIPRLADQYGVPRSEILTTYICQACKVYEVKSFTEQNQNCKCCNTEKSQITTNVNIGVTESQLNEVYNLMDFYIHPITSGGQELPCACEAPLTELCVATTNYSCGEEICENNPGAFPLDFDYYTEHGTEFLKSTTKPSSIAKQIKKFYHLPENKKRELGKNSRRYVLDNYSINVIGRIFEDWIDSLPEHNYSFEMEVEQKNPNAQIPQIQDNRLWVKSLYKEILKMEVSDQDEGLKSWLDGLEKGKSREDIHRFFIETAIKENQKNQKISINDLFDKNDNKRAVLVIKESIGDIYLFTSLLESFKGNYPNHDIYVVCEPQFFEIFEGNPYVHKCLPYHPFFENEIAVTGVGKNKGVADVYCNVAIGTQKVLNYLTNNKLALELESK